jgi:16S rRNA (guanine966-N2)-methyltransferase
VPDTPETRPTMDRTRQAIFNILRSASWALKKNGAPVLQDAHIIDVFAGSGAMGFEALSQGAESCIFVDNAKLAFEAIQKNIDKIGLSEKAKLVKADIEKIAANTGAVCSMAFLDPPYYQGLLPKALKILQDRNYIDTKTLLVLELHKSETMMDLQVLDERVYGTSKVIFARLD